MNYVATSELKIATVLNYSHRALNTTLGPGYTSDFSARHWKVNKGFFSSLLVEIFSPLIPIGRFVFYFFPRCRSKKMSSIQALRGVE